MFMWGQVTLTAIAPSEHLLIDITAVKVGDMKFYTVKTWFASLVMKCEAIV